MSGRYKELDQPTIKNKDIKGYLKENKWYEKKH
jgi:hypothetical protein